MYLKNLINKQNKKQLFCNDLTFTGVNDVFGYKVAQSEDLD